MASNVDTLPRVPVAREVVAVQRAIEQGRPMDIHEKQAVMSFGVAAIVLLGTFAMYLTNHPVPNEILMMDGGVVAFYFRGVFAPGGGGQ